ncbi:MAG: DUF533 domain-containing protein [Acidobacteriota bacterium]
MGFIDRMLADLIGKNTGLDRRTARRLVRGKGSSLLMMGGAAALGAVIADGVQRNAAQTAATGGPHPGVPPGTPPPGTPQGTLPATPGPSPSAAPPTLPPLPTTPQPATPQPMAPQPMAPQPAAPQAASLQPSIPPADAGPPISDPDGDVDLAPDTAYPIVRAMVAAALADGELGDTERQAIHEHLADSGLSPEQTAQIHRDLVLPPSVTMLAAASDDPAVQAAMYRCAGAVVLADGAVADAERRWLDQLATALGFDDTRRAALEREIFDPG